MCDQTTLAKKYMSSLHRYFFDPPSSKLVNNPWCKYGFLAFTVALLGACIWMSCTFSPPDHDRFSRLLVPSMLILNHLTGYFYFGPRFTFPFRLFSTVFLLAGCVFVFANLFSSFQGGRNESNFNVDVRQSKPEHLNK